jgi:hypothetical protein
MNMFIDDLRIVLDSESIDEKRAAHIAMLTCKYLGELDLPLKTGDITVEELGVTINTGDMTTISDELLAHRCAAGIGKALLR